MFFSKWKQKKQTERDNAWLNNWLVQNSAQVELRVENFSKRVKDKLVKHQQQVSSGQDKYQIGKALFRFHADLTSEYSNLFREGIPYLLVDRVKELPAIKQSIDEIENVKQSLTDLIDSDISIENGFLDMQRDEQHKTKIEHDIKSLKNKKM